MKRVLFLLVSAFIAGTTFASNLTKEVVSRVSKDEVVLSDNQNQTLILEKASDAMQLNQWHYSHSSHASHSSHVSHRSHSSHYSSRF